MRADPRVVSFCEREAVPSLAGRRRLLLATEIVAVYVRVRWCMRRRDLPTVVVQLRRGPAGRTTGMDDFITALRLGNAVVRTLRVLPAGSRCLVRSLVLTALLAARGVESTLVIGVRPGPKFSAHAWVEHRGRPLLPSGSGEFARVSEF
jgi:hypothetical protein